MRYSILNTSDSTYRSLWDLLREEECLIDIPYECVPQEWISLKMDDALTVKDDEELSPLWHLIMKEVQHHLDAGATVTPYLSHESAFLLRVGDVNIPFPYIHYEIEILIK